MKNLRVFILLVLVLIILTACNNSITQSVDTEEYNGMELKIGIIGQIPEIREKELVKFEEIQFSDLAKQDIISQFDSIFITKDNLVEASKARYVSIYKESKIPYFFIESNKSHIPFTEDNLSYSDVPNLSEKEYITGILYEGDSFQYWGYGLYNDVKSQKNIYDVYTRTFKTISQNSNKIDN